MCILEQNQLQEYLTQVWKCCSIFDDQNKLDDLIEVLLIWGFTVLDHFAAHN